MIHKDKRGIIKDILTDVNIDAVTLVTFTKGAVRGNHFHKQTVQWDYVLEGLLFAVTDTGRIRLKTGDLICHPRGVPHAYKAIKPSKLLSMTLGPRKGERFESDTFRLDIPLIS